MKDTPNLALLLVASASILGAAGQFLFKAGSAKPELSATTFLASPLIISGMLSYTRQRPGAFLTPVGAGFPKLHYGRDPAPHNAAPGVEQQPQSP